MLTHLLDDVQLAEPVEPLRFRERRELDRVLLADIRHVAEPVVDEAVPRALERRVDTAAAVVPADDHVLDAEDVDGVLEHREAIEVGVDDDVRDVPVDEHVPGASPTIWFAGTRLSEQPIHRYSGDWRSTSAEKKSGSSATAAAAQARLRSKSSVRSPTAVNLSGAAPAEIRAAADIVTA